MALDDDDFKPPISTQIWMPDLRVGDYVGTIESASRCRVRL